MPYKISGSLNEAATVLVLREDTWAVEIISNEDVGPYEIDALVSGTKTVVAITSEGELMGYGDVDPIEY